jgi:hypothetical protein
MNSVSLRRTRSDIATSETRVVRGKGIKHPVYSGSPVTKVA